MTVDADINFSTVWLIRILSITEAVVVLFFRMFLVLLPVLAAS